MQVLVRQFGTKSWYKISKLMKMPEIQCHNRWLELNNDSHIIKHGGWSKAEDKILVQRVSEIGTRNWVAVANGLPGRIGKQCRERWYKTLDPNIC